MGNRTTSSDAEGISHQFAQIIANNGGSATFVNLVRASARGESIQDKFHLDYLVMMVAYIARGTVLTMALVQLLQWLF